MAYRTRRMSAARAAAQALEGSHMSKPPPARPRSQELRKEIDAIDEQVHRLLMQRGDIIDRLIQVKQTQEVGSAFRPAREADMMRRLVQRHRGILPLDTVESIWRVIISTFTYVQAPFSVHADLSVGEPAMRDSARFHFGFTVPYVAHFSAQAAVEAVAKSKGDLALVSATSSRAPWWIALEADGAPKIIARLPFLERADHPAALPVFVISRVADDAMVTEVEMWSVRVSGWNADIARALSPLAEIVAVPDTAFDGAALLVSVARRRPRKDQGRPDRSGGLGALVGPRRQPRNALYGAPERDSQVLTPQTIPELKMTRPVPNPGILDIAPYTPGKSPVPEPGRKVFKLSANETPFGPSPKAIAAYKQAARSSGGLSGRHLARAARSDRPHLRARPRPHHLRRRLGRDPQFAGAHLSQPRRRGDLHRARLSGLSDRDHGERREKCRRTGDRLHRRCRCHPQAGDAAHQAGLARQSEQSDRHLRAVRRGQAAARRPAAACAAGARRRLFRLRLAQRLRGRHRAGRDHREHGDDAHLLQDPRPCRAADRLDVRPGAISSMRSTASAAPSTSRRRRCCAAVAAIEDTAHVQMSKAHTETVAQLADRGDRQARAQGDAERRQFRADPFPDRQGQDRGGGRRVPHQARPRAARA